MSAKERGFTVRIFIPFGDPEGLRIIEKANWVGQGVVFPRSQYEQASKRNELKRTGVYILWGPDTGTELPRIYIGEGDNVLDRLNMHHQQKDFWTHAVVFTSKDDNLNKASVKFIEAKLVKLAKDAKMSILDNNQTPSYPHLSEADQADTEAFLSDMLLCLPLVGADFFEKTKKPEKGRKVRYLIRSKNIEAHGYESVKGFVVEKGSYAVVEEVPSIPSSWKRLRETLVEQGILAKEGSIYKFTQDYEFKSPSAAASAILGRSANGRIEWKTEDGKTLKEIQERQISSL